MLKKLSISDVVDVIMQKSYLLISIDIFDYLLFLKMTCCLKSNGGIGMLKRFFEMLISFAVQILKDCGSGHKLSQG